MVMVNLNGTDGNSYEIDVLPGESLMRAALRNRVPGIIGECGGAMACGTCHVFVHDEWIDSVPSPGSEESDMLEMFDDDCAGSRLSCQLKFEDRHDGFTVDVAENNI